MNAAAVAASEAAAYYRALGQRPSAAEAYEYIRSAWAGDPRAKLLPPRMPVTFRAVFDGVML